MKEHAKSIAAVVALIVAFFVLRATGMLPEFNLEKLLTGISSSLGAWTYPLVGVMAFLETGAFVGLIAPGEFAVMIGGVVAGRGEIDLFLMIAITWFSAWGGDTASFWLGQHLGRDAVLRHGHRVRITPERFAQVERYFAEHGGKTILIGRFLGLVRALAPFIAGSSGMRYREFLPFSILGTGLWAGLFTVLGYVFSRNIQGATQLAKGGGLVFGTTVTVIVGLILLRRATATPKARERSARWMEQYAPTRLLLNGLRRIYRPLNFAWQRITPGNLGLELTAQLALLAVGTFVLVAYGVQFLDNPAPTLADERASAIAEALRSDWVVTIAKIVTQLGSTVAISVLSVGTAVWLGWKRRWVELAVLVAATLGILIANPLVKELVQRPRPAGGLIEVGGWGFPSGHAAHSTLYAWVAVVVAVRVLPGWTSRGTLVTVGFALTAAIGLSRVELGVHQLSDVLGGWALGSAVLCVCGITGLIVDHVRHNDRDVAVARSGSS